MGAPGYDLLLIDDECYSEEGEDSLGVVAARWAFEPPKLAVPLLSAQAKAAGLSVRSVYRPFLPWKLKAFRELLAARPLAVGITTVAMFRPGPVARLAAAIRAASPGTVIFLGGHGAANSREIRELGDVYISEHGEGALAAAVLALKAGAKPAELPGLCPGPEGSLHIRGALRYEGMGKVLYPDWDATSSACRRYPIEASRGCRFNCSFCGFPGKAGQSFRPAGEVAGEMLHARVSRGIRRFEFVDSSLTSDPAYVRGLCAAIKASGLEPEWKCFARPDSFGRDEGLAREMAAAGCSKVFMGIESIHDHILDVMRRGMRRETVELGLRRALEAGLKVHGNFIIGFPGETEATVAETAEFVAARPFSSVYLCTFGASQEILDLAAQDPLRYAHLAGRPVKGWKHDGMDYAKAYELTLAAARRINLRKFRPVAFSPVTNAPNVPPF